ncbi:MAG: right-handed parallel beta-helix repeat-containing protein [Deltaproteobacteria bacterium]|nr:right-handed parallel beta-helix repeat-containing protein [Deltaproteobacteria bacterium]
MILNKKIIYLFAIIALLAMSPGGGADQANFPDIYIDGATGGDGSLASPLTDFASINWTTGGDNSVYDAVAAGKDVTINLKKGVTWREQMTVDTSGSVAHPVTIQAYGEGANPIIDGSDEVATWTQEVIGGEDFTDGTGDKPVAWWLFEDTNWLDESTNDNDLTATGTISLDVENVEGTYSAKFENDNSEELHITDGNLSSGFPAKNGDGSTDFTIGGWFYFWEDADLTGGLFAKAAGGNSGFSIENFSWGHRFLYEENGVGGEDITIAPFPFSADTWYHLVYRWNGSGADETAIFVDGSKHGTTGTLTDLAESTGSFIIGENAYGSHSSQLVDEFFVFDISLSDAEILDIKNYGLDGTRGAITEIYKATCAWTCAQVYEDSTLLTKVTWDTNIATTATSMSAGTWSLDDANDLLYVWATDDADPDTHTMTVSRRDYGIRIVDMSYITIADIITQYCNASGISLATWNGTISNNIIDSCTSRYNYQYGFIGAGGNNHDHEENVRNCTIYNNGFHGIVVTLESNGCVVENNTSYNNGISEEASTPANIIIVGTGTQNNIIQNNISYNASPGGDETDGNGIAADTVGSGNIIRYNESYDNNRFGIMVEDSDGVKVCYNLVYGNSNKAGIAILRSSHDNLVYNNVCYNNDEGILIQGTIPSSPEGDMTGNIVKNNICSGNTTREFAATYGGENDGTYGSGNVYTYNCFGAEASNFIEWGLENYDSTYDNWETSYSGSTYSVESNPLMTDPGSDDFTLQVGSPCINRGTFVGLILDYLGLPVPIGHRPDIGAYEHKNGGAVIH